MIGLCAANFISPVKLATATTHNKSTISWSIKMIRLVSLVTVGFLLSPASAAEMFACFEDKDTLRDAALRYGNGSPAAQADAETYGAEISDWCLSETLTDLSFLLSGPISFNQDISGWNVSHVTNMSSMFSVAFGFRADISEWDVSSVEDMQDMFKQAFAFNVDISGWNVSRVTVMTEMFYGASVFDQNLCAWKDLLPVFNTTGMFENTACPFKADPTSRDSSTFCQACPARFRTASPSSFPSNSPSTSPAPTVVPSVSPSFAPSQRQTSVTPPTDTPPQVYAFHVVEG